MNYPYFFDKFLYSGSLSKNSLRRMKDLFDNLSENMTEEETEKAEKEIEYLFKFYYVT